MKDILNSQDYNFLYTDPLLKSSLSYLVIGGSHAYGLATENSDIDLRGFFVNKLDDFISLSPPEDHYEDKKTDTVLYSLHKFVKLLSACNPNVLELMGQDLVPIYSSQISNYLRDNMHLFLSQRVFTTFAGYSIAQLRRLQNSLSNNVNSEEVEIEQLWKSLSKEKLSNENLYEGIHVYLDQTETPSSIKVLFDHIPLKKAINASSQFKNILTNYNKLNSRNRKKDDNHLYKHASCLIRLLLSGIDILKTGQLRTKLTEHLDLLKEIRFGYMTFDKVFKLHEKLEVELQKAKDETKLPLSVDLSEINNILKEFYLENKFK